MRVMVTGGTGFVGSHAVRCLVDSGHDVRLLVRSADKLDEVLGDLGSAVADFVVGDMTDADAVGSALDGCDAALHTAAVVGVSSAGGSQSVNVAGARTVLGRAASRGLDPIVYTSTTAVFMPTDDDVVTLDSELCEPLSGYGKSKVAVEHYVRGLADAGAPVVTIYPGGVLGPDSPTLDSALEGVATALQMGFPDAPTGGMLVIDVRDLARIIVGCFEPGFGPRRYMAGGRFFGWSEFNRMIDAITGRQVRKIRMPAWGFVAGGRALDLVRRVRPVDYALTYDSALFIVGLKPVDDSATLEAFAIEPRPAADTLADSIRWMVSAGHLEPEHAGVLA